MRATAVAMSSVDFKLYLITDRKQCRGRPLVEVVDAACTAGVRAVQLREKDLTPIEVFRLGQKVNAITDRHGARLFINDRADVALALHAEGVHLATNSLPASAVRPLLRAEALLGASTHNLDELLQAQAEGADFATFGPVYHTASKAAYGEPVGLRALAQACQAVTIPVFALGGITPERVSECVQAGAWGIACISAVTAAENVAEAVARFAEELGGL